MRRMYAFVKTRWGLLKILWVVLPPVTGAGVLLFGSGLLLGPKIAVSGGAINLKIPMKFQLDYFTTKMMLAAPELLGMIFLYLGDELRELGLPEEKVKRVVADVTTDVEDKKLNWSLANSMEAGKRVAAADSLAELEPHERRIMSVALQRAMLKANLKVVESVRLPDAILFFEIRNDGRTSASDVHAVVTVQGAAYEVTIDTNNKMTDQRREVSRIEIDFASLAPHSRTRGIIWYSHMAVEAAYSRNEVSVVHDRGTVSQAISEDTFILK